MVFFRVILCLVVFIELVVTIFMVGERLNESN